MAQTNKKTSKVTITKKITAPPSSETDSVLEVEQEMTDNATIAYSMAEDNPFQVAEEEESVTITLSGVMDLAVSSDFKEALLYATSLNKTLILEGSQVDQLSTPSIQLILAAQIKVTESGNEAILLNPSQDFAGAFDDLGLFSSLMKWKVQS